MSYGASEFKKHVYETLVQIRNTGDNALERHIAGYLLKATSHGQDDQFDLELLISIIAEFTDLGCRDLDEGLMEYADVPTFYNRFKSEIEAMYAGLQPGHYSAGSDDKVSMTENVFAEVACRIGKKLNLRLHDIREDDED